MSLPIKPHHIAYESGCDYADQGHALEDAWSESVKHGDHRHWFMKGYVDARC